MDGAGDAPGAARGAREKTCEDNARRHKTALVTCRGDAESLHDAPAPDLCEPQQRGLRGGHNHGRLSGQVRGYAPFTSGRSLFASVDCASEPVVSPAFCSLQICSLNVKQHQRIITKIPGTSCRMSRASRA